MDEDIKHSNSSKIETETTSDLFNNIVEKEDEKNPQEEINEDVPKGAILKQARIAKGLSLETIHEVTKIPLDALKAIEEGYEVRTLSSFYYKGFLKIYANYLDVNVSEVIDDYKPKKFSKPIYREREEIIFDWQQWLVRHFTKKRKRQLLILLGALAAIFLLIKFAGFLKNRVPKEVAADSQGQIREERPSTERSTAQRSGTTAPKPPLQADVSKAGTVQNITLTVRAKKESWLRVKSDGEVVFQTTLQKGVVETWSAMEKIEIAGPNINQLEFELNGKMIGTLGREDRKAKILEVTKDGLKVTK